MSDHIQHYSPGGIRSFAASMNLVHIWRSFFSAQWIAASTFCIISILIGFNIDHAAWYRSIDVGSEEFIVEGQTSGITNYYGYQESEWGGGRTFRRTSERAALGIPSGLRIGGAVAFEMTACGCYVDRTEDVFHISTNQTPTITAVAQNVFRHYTVMLPSQTTHPSYDMLIELRSPTWRTDDGRDVGIAVDRINFRQKPPLPLSSSSEAIILAISLVITAWKKRPPWTLLLLSCVWIFSIWFIQPQFLPEVVVIAGAVFGLAILAIFSSKWELIIAATIAIWMAFSSQILGHWIVDDAYISFRYAQQLIRGHGLVFNTGEYVEGYTNFLWTMIIAGSMSLGLDPALFSSIATFILGFVIIILTVLIAKHLVSSFWAWMAALLMSLCSSFLLYTVRGSGMETALFTALLLSVVLSLIRRAWFISGICTVLLLLTRPDAVLLAGISVIFVLIYSPPGRMARIRSLLLYGGTIAVLYIPYFAWRWWYYGYPLPNTFYAKVSENGSQVWRGIAYLGAFASSSILLISGIVGGLVCIWVYRKARSHSWFCGILLTTIASVYGSYIIYVGGDWMPGFRFGMPLVPILALLTVWGTETIAHRNRFTRWSSIVLTLLLSMTLIQQLPRDSAYLPSTRVWAENDLVVRYREIGRWLAVHTPPDTMVAVSAAGVIPFYADRPALDVLGLNDEYIAHLPSTTMGQGKAGHEKTDPNYVLERRPDIIPWVTAPWVIEHPLFETNYHLIRVSGPEGRHIQLFIHNDSSVDGATQ